MESNDFSFHLIYSFDIRISWNLCKFHGRNPATWNHSRCCQDGRRPKSQRPLGKKWHGRPETSRGACTCRCQSCVFFSPPFPCLGSDRTLIHHIISTFLRFYQNEDPKSKWRWQIHMILILIYNLISYDINYKCCMSSCIFRDLHK